MDVNKITEETQSTEATLTNDDIIQLKDFLTYHYYDIPYMNGRVFQLEEENRTLKKELQMAKNDFMTLKYDLESLKIDVCQNVGKFVREMSSGYVSSVAEV